MSLRVFESLEQGSKEWIDARCGLVTASTVGKLLTSTGKIANNETSRSLTDALATERITGRVEFMPESIDMRRGTILEPSARDLYAEHHALVEEIGFMTREFEEGFRIGYSPDGLVGDEGLLEIKSRKPRIQVQTIRTGLPAANMAQLQCGLLVSGRAWIDYCSYSPGLPLYVQRVHPDLAWFAAIHDAAYQFEQRVADLVNDYQFEVEYHNMPMTEFFDPFDQEEEVIYG